MADTTAFIGEIRIWGATFIPQNWMLCNGAVLAIADNQTLYSVIGTRFGGNGTTTFMLPNFNNTAPVGVGAGPGLPNIFLGAPVGQSNITLTENNLPPHTHELQAQSGLGNQQSPLSHYSTDEGNDVRMVFASTTDATMQATSASGNPAVNINITQPSMAMQFIICVNGIYPV